MRAVARIAFCHRAPMRVTFPISGATMPNPKGPLPDFSDVKGGSSSAASGSTQEREVTYTVQKGDSLSKIARDQYGDGKKGTAIFEANRDQITNPDLIHPGQVLKIPTL
jgi:nucleoid-associated protein YgaU